MNPISARSRLRLRPLAWVLVPALVTTIFTVGTQISGAQSADTDADGYADQLEEELGSNPTDANSTPEHFSLLWSCTDGNDNDDDGTRDFADQGCGVTGSPAPTPAATATPGPTATQGAGSGSGSGGGSSSDGGGSSGSGDSGSGQGGTNGSGTSETGGDGSDGGGQGSVAGIGAAGSTSGGEGGSTSDGGDDASSADGSGGDGGFPWMLLLIILAAVLTLASIGYALVARSQARSRSYRMAKP